MQVFGANVLPMEILVVFGAVAMMLAVEFFNRKTIYGKAVVATFNDRDAAKLMGINTGLVITFSYALSSATAAFAGALASLPQAVAYGLIAVSTLGAEYAVFGITASIGSAILFCLITALLYLHYEQKLNTRQLGGFVMLVINAAVGFILWYTFDRQANNIQPLVPALQSYWMKIHVPANFVGYGAFSLAAMVASAYLLASKGILSSRLPTLDVLEDLMYKAIAVGFAFFTIATILGAMWAAEAWGGYWSWDPKETWALIVWLNYAAWLHLRMVKGLRGPLLAWWALIGLLVTTFAFLGVNMFLSGLHSYGTL